MRLYRFRLAGPAYYVVAPSYIAAMRLLLLREIGRASCRERVYVLV